MTTRQKILSTPLKKLGFSNAEIRELTVNLFKIENLVDLPTYKMVEPDPKEFPASLLLFHDRNRSANCEEVGPHPWFRIRIGQGIDQSLREEGIEVHILNR